MADSEQEKLRKSIARIKYELGEKETVLATYEPGSRFYTSLKKEMDGLRKELADEQRKL
jgi:ribosomal protein L29